MHTVEERLVNIWLSILNIENIDINQGFYNVGGNSLQAVKMLVLIEEEFDVELPLESVLYNSTISMLANELRERADESSFKHVQAVENLSYYPVTSAQKRMYFLHYSKEDNVSYNMPFFQRIKGVLDKQRFENIIDQLVLRHEVLRTKFTTVKGEVVQSVCSIEGFRMEYFGTNGTEALELLQTFVRPFDLESGLLIRAGMVQIEKDEHIFMLDMHHIVSDGISMGIFLKEFMDLYHHQKLQPQPLQYKDFAVWYEDFFKSEIMIEQREYWKKKLSSPRPILDMPLDFERGEKRIFEGEQIKLVIPEQTTRRLLKLALGEGITLNTLLFGIYGLLVSLYSRQEDLIIGSIVAGRRHKGLENMMGVFINFLPIQIQVDQTKTFLQYLEQTNTSLMEAYNHQDYPFEHMVEDLNANWDRSKNPIMDTMFVFHNEWDTSFTLNGLEVSDVELEHSSSLLDFKMDVFLDGNKRLYTLLEYDKNLFKHETMETFVGHFEELIEVVLDNPWQNVKEIELLRKTEREELDTRKYKEETGITNIVVSATFTAEPIEEYLNWWSNKFDEKTRVHFSQYNNIFQELLDPNSLTSKNKGINIFLIRFEDWIRDKHHSLESEKRKVLEGNFEILVNALKNLTTEVPYFIGLFPVATYSLQSNELRQLITQLIVRFKAVVSEYRNIHIIDFSETVQLFQVQKVFDPITDRAGHIPFSQEFFSVIGMSIARKVLAHKSHPFKVIAVDCDNTLWKGVCGEDGSLGVTVEGSFKKLQQFLIQKSNEGMLLTLCSKNNESDVWEVFEKNPQMVLKKENFVEWKLNWGDKSQNLRELAHELNLGLDSFIFIDDDPAVCTEVMINTPEVLVLQLPSKSEQIPDFLNHVWAFDRVQDTQEDRNRTDLYLNEKKRKNAQERAFSLSDFMTELDLKVSMNFAQQSQISRIAQLTQRTNQFNLSTIRRSEMEINELFSKHGMKCWEIEALDKFGEYGIIGVLITKEKGNVLFIDTFLLSCRSLGRGIEDVILTGLKRYCTANGLFKIEADFYPTPKNRPFLNFIEKLEWAKEKEKSQFTKYSMDVSKIKDNVNHVDFYFGDRYEKKGYNDLSSNNGITQSTVSIRDEQNIGSIHDKKYWEINFVNRENLVHFKYYLPLIYHNAELLQDIQFESQSNARSNKKYVAPKTKIEQKLTEIWSSLLGISPIGVHEDFFQIGGQSLKATTLMSKVYQEWGVDIPLLQIFETPTIYELAEYIKNTHVQPRLEIKPIKSRDHYPLSAGQQRMFVLDYNHNCTSYNNPSMSLIRGNLDIDRVNQVIQQIIKRHESLRTSFTFIEDQPVQIIQKEVDFQLTFTEDIGGEPEIIANEFIKAFDLSDSPLMRASVVLLESDYYFFMLDLHHIISDGVSLNIFWKEFFTLYKGEKLPEVVLQYKDYAIWQKELMETDFIQEQEAYWLEEFATEPKPLDLPFDNVYDDKMENSADHLLFKVDQELISKIKHIKGQKNVTLYMILLAAYKILLHKYSDQEEIVVGSPIAARAHPECESIFGMMVNTLALRTRLQADMPFDSYLDTVKRKVLMAFQHQDYPFERLVEKLNLVRNVERQPLFDTIFILQNMESTIDDIKGLSFTSYTPKGSNAKMAMILEGMELDGEIQFRLEYNKSLFLRETIIQLKKDYLNILRQIVDNPMILLKEIELENQYRVIENNFTEKIIFDF